MRGYFNHYRPGLLLLIGVLFYFSAHAQISVQGNVMNSSGEPMPDARVVVPTLKIGTGTDQLGKFELLIPDQRLRLSVSYIGYQTKWISLSPEMADDKNVIQLDLVLESSVNGLPEAVVLAEQRAAVIENFHTAVLDFDFLQNELIVLVSEGKKYFLRTYSEDGQSGLSMTLDKRPEQLFRDCFGGLHLIYKYHVDELSIIDEKIIILAKHSVEDFKAFLEPCSVANEQSIVFENREENDQTLRYSLVPRTGGEKTLLREISDHYSLEMIAAENREIFELEELLFSGAITDPIALLHIEREIQQKKWFKKIILSQPTYHPCFQINDSIIIFDHLSNEAILFSSTGNEARHIAIDHHLRRDWGSRVFQDLETEEIYLEFVKAGVSTLNLFNTDTGEYAPVWRIVDHAYPEKLKIIGGKMWYIHQAVDQSAPALYSVHMSLNSNY